VGRKLYEGDPTGLEAERAIKRIELGGGDADDPTQDAVSGAPVL
jgi:hypothetical protein